jgi:hypothetical protein
MNINLYIITVDVTEQHHVGFLVRATSHLEDGSTSCSGMDAAARTTGSGQLGPPTRGRQPDLIYSSLSKNHKQTQTFYNSINLVRVPVN